MVWPLVFTETHASSSSAFYEIIAGVAFQWLYSRALVRMTDTDTQIHGHTQAHKHTQAHTQTLTDRQTDRQTDRETERQRGRQAIRQTERQTP